MLVASTAAADDKKSWCETRTMANRRHVAALLVHFALCYAGWASGKAPGLRATDDAIRETAIGTVLLAVLLCAIAHRSYVGVVAIGCTLFKHLAWVLLHTDVGITDTHIFWGTLVLPLVGAFRPASSRATMAFGLFELRCDCRIGTIDVPIFYSPASILSARR